MRNSISQLRTFQRISLFICTQSNVEIKRQYIEVLRELQTNKLRNEYLDILSKDDDLQIQTDICYFLRDFFEEIPKTLRERILIQLLRLNNVTIRRECSILLVKQPSLRRGDFKYLLDQLCEDSDIRVRQDIVTTLREHFDNLPKQYRNNILLKMSRDEKYEINRRVAYLIARHFDKIPKHTREQILLDYTMKKRGYKVRKRVITIVRSNFTKITPAIRRRIIQNLVHDRYDVVKAKARKVAKHHKMNVHD